MGEGTRGTLPYVFGDTEHNQGIDVSVLILDQTGG
jgi:hypothetical protein